MSMAAKRLNPAMTLTELMQDLVDAPAIPVAGIASDSRDLQSGYVFLAIGGESSHGLDYAAAAADAGAAAIVYDASTAVAVPERLGIPLLAVADLRSHIGDIANRYFVNPSRDVRVIGITGTNGKTTVAWLIAQCLERLGRHCGYIGTLGHGIGEIEIAEGMTTPDVVELHRRIAGFRDAGASHAAVEVSSHALAQQRTDGVHFDAALLTNLTRDHLDYHGDMRTYGEAKASLFLAAQPNRRVINIDSEFGADLAVRCGPEAITVSTKPDRVANGQPCVFVRSFVARSEGTEIAIHSTWGDGNVWLPLPGEFNVANAAAVVALLVSDGVPIGMACDVLSEIDAPPGRMQRVVAGDHGPTVYVDYAHTPDALEHALRALRPHCSGSLWCVFGCGGDRDSGKRPLMGGAAELNADRVVVTSDNPRGERPDAIIDEILAGLGHPQHATVIEDRAAAIAWAIRNASDADIVLLAGKGHENYQLVGASRLRFSDYGTVAANLLARKSDAGKDS